jgi:hypothetical protein
MFWMGFGAEEKAHIAVFRPVWGLFYSKRLLICVEADERCRLEG